MFLTTEIHCFYLKIMIYAGFCISGVKNYAEKRSYSVYFFKKKL